MLKPGKGGSLERVESTPLYNKAILVTEKHPAEIFFLLVS